jgi:hypothetical protein
VAVTRNAQREPVSFQMSDSLFALYWYSCDAGASKVSSLVSSEKPLQPPGIGTAFS